MSATWASLLVQPWFVPGVCGLVGGLVGAGLLYLWLRPRLAAADQLEIVAHERDDARSELASVSARFDAEQMHSAEKLALLTQAKTELTHQFESLSQKILDEKTKKFTESNRQSMELLLNPVRERIGEFQKQVSDVYNQETRDRAALKAEITHLRSMHQQMSEDAQRLTRALKGDNKAQGGWGEVILQRVFEASGLAEGREYELQVNLKSESGGNLRPDAVIHLPEGRAMIVDAKVSLTAYERYHGEENDTARAAALADHVKSVKGQVDNLSGKSYETLSGLVTPDFVLLFIPVEGAYIEAMRADPSLHEYALKKNVVLLAPSNLLPTLRVVENMWRVDRQNRNARKIADEAGKMYDKFVLFVKDIEEIGDRIRQAGDAYDNAHKKLGSGRGHLLGRAEKLRKLGASAAKTLEADTRSGQEADLDAPDFEDDGPAGAGDA